MNEKNLIGKDDSSLALVPETNFLLRPEVIQSLIALQSKALTVGIDIQIVSAFRTYERQLHIWNEKASGRRTVLDSQGNKLNFTALNCEDRMWAILRYSALPGTSRHHWGTDLDIFDAATQKREEVQLISSEWSSSGPNAKLNEWLNFQLEKDSLGFFRPYKEDLGGVAPEPWHISFKPLASQYRQEYDYALFVKNIEESSILLKEEVLKHSKEIYERFFI